MQDFTVHGLIQEGSESPFYVQSVAHQMTGRHLTMCSSQNLNILQTLWGNTLTLNCRPKFEAQPPKRPEALLAMPTADELRCAENGDPWAVLLVGILRTVPSNKGFHRDGCAGGAARIVG